MIEDAYGERVVGGFRRKPSRDQQQSSDVSKQESCQNFSDVLKKDSNLFFRTLKQMTLMLQIPNSR